MTLQESNPGHLGYEQTCWPYSPKEVISIGKVLTGKLSLFILSLGALHCMPAWKEPVKENHTARELKLLSKSFHRKKVTKFLPPFSRVSRTKTFFHERNFFVSCFLRNISEKNSTNSFFPANQNSFPHFRLKKNQRWSQQAQRRHNRTCKGSTLAGNSQIWH